MNTKIRKLYILLISLIPILISSCSTKLIEYDSIDNNSSSSNISGKLTISGSTSMTKLSNALGEEFSKIYPNISVEKSDTGSGAAVNSVLSATALIGDISRELKESESPQKFNQVTIAFDGIVLIVNKNNPINNLTSQQIKDIFHSKITNWQEVGGNNQPIILIGREESSGTRENFENIFNPEGYHINYHAEFPESGDIISKVSSDSSAIGYISLASTSDNIKALSIDGIKATNENIINNVYTLKRPFIQIYLKDTENIIIEKWFEFIRSEKGQQIISNQSFIPNKIN